MTPDSPVLGDEGRARLQEALEDVFTLLRMRERDLPEAAAKVLRENLWELYETSLPAAVRAPRPAPPEATEVQQAIQSLKRFKVNALDDMLERDDNVPAEFGALVLLSDVLAVLSASLGRPTETTE